MFLSQCFSISSARPFTSPISCLESGVSVLSSQPHHYYLSSRAANRVLILTSYLWKSKRMRKNFDPEKENTLHPVTASSLRPQFLQEILYEHAGQVRDFLTSSPNSPCLYLSENVANSVRSCYLMCLPPQPESEFLRESILHIASFPTLYMAPHA